MTESILGFLHHYFIVRHSDIQTVSLLEIAPLVQFEAQVENCSPVTRETQFRIINRRNHNEKIIKKRLPVGLSPQ